MKLQQIDNYFRNTNGAKTEIIPIGYGSEAFKDALTNRLGDRQAYILIDGMWRESATGKATERLYGLTSEQLDLFNAYDALKEGMEMVGYGENIEHAEEGYEYSFFDELNCEFTKLNDPIFFDKMIYARRKKMSPIEKRNSEILNSILKQFFTEYNSDKPFVFLNSLLNPDAIDRPSYKLVDVYEDFSRHWIHLQVEKLYLEVMIAVNNEK